MPRVIAGVAKGLQLATPERGTRPTLDRVREALFSILNTRLEGARFADLYAGSGANGIEALSRGAAHCAFVDTNAQAIHTIGENLFHTKLEHKSRSYQLTLPNALGVVASKEPPFDIVFCDPPYTGAGYSDILSQIIESKILAKDGLVVIEHESKVVLPPSVGALQKRREARYGRVGISFFA